MNTILILKFFRFPDDPETYTQNTQFLWGRGLLIVPVLEEVCKIKFFYILVEELV